MALAAGLTTFANQVVEDDAPSYLIFLVEVRRQYQEGDELARRASGAVGAKLIALLGHCAIMYGNPVHLELMRKWIV